MGDIEHEDGPPVMESMGPIQMTSFAFPGNRFKGEILPELEKLKKAEIVRIVDLLLVRKDELGNVMVTTASDLDWEEAVSFGSYVGALAGYAAAGPAGIEKGAMAGAAELADGHLFDEDDVFRVTQALPNEHERRARAPRAPVGEADARRGRPRRRHRALERLDPARGGRLRRAPSKHRRSPRADRALSPVSAYGTTRCVQMFRNSSVATALSEPEKLSVPAAKTRAPCGVS